METQNMNEDSDSIYTTSTEESQETETVQIKIFKNPTIQKVISHFEGVVAEKERLFDSLYKDYFEMVDEMNDWKTKCLQLQKELDSIRTGDQHHNSSKSQLDNLIQVENEEKQAKTLVWDILCELKNGWCVDSKSGTVVNVSSPTVDGETEVSKRDTSQTIEKILPMVEKLFELIENDNAGEQQDGNEKIVGESNSLNDSCATNSPSKSGSNQNMPCNAVTSSNRREHDVEYQLLMQKIMKNTSSKRRILEENLADKKKCNDSDTESATTSEKVCTTSTIGNTPLKDSSTSSESMVKPVVPTLDHQMPLASVSTSTSISLDGNKLIKGLLGTLEHSETQTPESWLTHTEPFYLIDSGSQTYTNAHPQADKWLQTPRHWVCNHLHPTPLKITSQGNEIFVETIATQTDDQWNPKSDAISDTTFEMLTTENDATLADNNSSNLVSPVTEFGTSSSASNIASKDDTSGQADSISADSNTLFPVLNQSVFKRESDIAINYTQVDGSEYGFTEYGEETPTPGGFTFASESETVGRSERFFNVGSEIQEQTNSRSPFHKMHDTCRSNHGRRQKCKLRKNSIRENIIASQSAEDTFDSSSNKETQYKDVFLCQPERRRGRKMPYYEVGKARSETVLNKSIHDMTHQQFSPQASRSDSNVTVSTTSEKSLTKAHSDTSNVSSQTNSNSKIFEVLMHSDTEKSISDSFKEKEKAEADSDTATLGGDEVNLCDVEIEDEMEGCHVEKSQDILEEVQQHESNQLVATKADHKNLDSLMDQDVNDSEIQSETTDIKMQTHKKKKPRDGRKGDSKMSQKSVNSPSPRNLALTKGGNKDSRPNSRTNSRPTSRQERSNSRKGKSKGRQENSAGWSSPRSGRCTPTIRQSQAEKKGIHEKDARKGVKAGKSPIKKEETVQNEISQDEVEITDQILQNKLEQSGGIEVTLNEHLVESLPLNPEVLARSPLDTGEEDRSETTALAKNAASGATDVQVEKNETPKAKKSKLKPSRLPRLSPQMAHTTGHSPPPPQKVTGKPPSKQAQKSQHLKTGSPGKSTGKMKNEPHDKTKLSATPPKSGGKKMNQKMQECVKPNEEVGAKQNNMALNEGDRTRPGKDPIHSGRKPKSSEKARSDTSVEQKDPRKKIKKSETRGGQTSSLKVASSADGFNVQKARGKDSTTVSKNQTPMKRDTKKSKRSSVDQN